jgi:hypothetical protein
MIYAHLATLALFMLFSGVLIRGAYEIGRARETYQPRSTAGRKLRIYISGAISSDPDHPDHFLRTALAIRKEGYDVICPTCLPDGLDYADYMHVDYALIDVSDAVYLMHNWETSPGAVAEKEYAELTGKRVLYGRHTKPHVVWED